MSKTQNIAISNNDTALTDTGAVNSSFANAAARPHKRTFGEKAVDFIVYPVINNFVVIGTSVIATYLTKRGDTVGQEGSTIRKIGNALKKRGDLTQEAFQTHLGMNEKSADMAKMVFFSFVDGTILTPFVKLLEDRREQMARWMDSHIGTKQADDLVYKTEPKQTWKSVIGGRIATLSVVLATAIGLNQEVKGRSINDRIFDVPSEELAKVLEKHTSIKQKFPKLDTHFFSKTLVFEAVYTSICTAGLYFISRAFVRNSKKHRDRVGEYKSSHEGTNLQSPQNETAALISPKSELAAEERLQVNAEGKLETVTGQELDAPRTSVSQTTHHHRVSAAPVQQEVTA